MKVRTILPFPLIFLLMASGDLGEVWNVDYETKSICAPAGSTVNMSCSYRYPEQLTLKDTLWIMCEKQKTEIKSLKEYPEYKDRVEYIEDRKSKTAILRLHNITENDERAYCFRLVTNTEGQKWIGKEEIHLNVSVLQVKAPQLVLEKQTVGLICETTCSLTEAFIWYKNGEALKIHSKTLQLQSERSDSARYSCAVRGHEHLPSPAVSITVMYPPQNVSVSISPSGEIVEGDSVTLSCSSDSNPPALNFSWFKENQSSAVGSGQSFSISSFNSSHSGCYYCEAQNKHGSQRSASVSASVKGVQRAALQTVTGIVVGCGGLIFIIIIIIIIIVIISRKRRRECGTEDVNQKQTADSSDDTYTALDPVSRTSDIYSTIRSGDSRAPDDTYTALRLQSRSSEYETLAVTSADPH